MGEKFLQFLGPGSKLGRVIRQVSATATPKSRKARPTPEEKKGLASTARGVTIRPPGLPRTQADLKRLALKARAVSKAEQDAREAAPPRKRSDPMAPASHRPGHVRRPQSSKARAASLRNLAKAKAALGRK